MPLRSLHLRRDGRDPPTTWRRKARQGRSPRSPHGKLRSFGKEIGGKAALLRRVSALSWQTERADPVLIQGSRAASWSGPSPRMLGTKGAEERHVELYLPIS